MTLHRAFLHNRFYIVLLLPLFILPFVFSSYYFFLIFNNILKSKIITNPGTPSSLYFHALSDIDYEISVIRHGAATKWNFTFTVGKRILSLYRRCIFPLSYVSSFNMKESTKE